MGKRCYLNAADLQRLNDACIRIREAFGDHPYLVGSVSEGSDYRDVDVRTIMPDDQFDEMFGGREFFWSLVCLAVSEYLRAVTGLPVDYQVQKMSVANERFGTRTEEGAREHHRSALGMSARLYAGGGDATKPKGSGE